MRTRDFDYPVPAEAIAQRPAPRGASRLLVADAQGPARHRRVGDLPSLLRAGDLLVVNDTEVIPARLLGYREPGGGRVEALLLAPELAPERAAREGCRAPTRIWEALVRPGRRLVAGTQICFTKDSARLAAVVGKRMDNGRAWLRFEQDPLPRLAELGHVPLPPYIRRPDDRADPRDYQTLFARHPGAVAAPTAGLHFDARVLEALAQAGIARASLTLHVGIGTFKPVSVDDIDDHVMERERFLVPEATVEAITRTRQQGGRVVAVGTTVVRALESAVDARGRLRAGAGSSELFIRPGYGFRAVDILLTNFHQPRSTLLMLVSAFAGRERILAAYREALAAGYRLYSYGDAMLVQRVPAAALAPG